MAGCRVCSPKSVLLTSILTSGTQHVAVHAEVLGFRDEWSVTLYFAADLPCSLGQTSSPYTPLPFHTFVMGALDCPALAKGGISPGPREGLGCGMTSWSPSQPLCVGFAGWLGVATALPGPPQGGSVHVYRKCRTRPGR